MMLRYAVMPWMAALSLTACHAVDPNPSGDSSPLTVTALRLAEGQSVTLDGQLDEPAWQAAPMHALGLAQSDLDKGLSLHEGATARLLWDDTHLYVGIELVDSDVVQEDDRDQQHHYRTGDLVEVFLKPDVGALPDGTPINHYWELYGTPNQRTTAMFFPSRGYFGLPSTLDNCTTRFNIAVKVQGTLNDWQQRDTGWSIEFAFPRAELSLPGVPLDPATPWRILIARYNYSAYLSDLELTAAPPLPEPAFHRFENWAKLELLENSNRP